MTDDRGNAVNEAGPSTPVEVLGFSEVPDAGDILNVAEIDKLSRQVAEERRLFYVGMTRARTSLYFTWCTMRRQFAGAAAHDIATAARNPSSFLFEFSPELVSPPPHMETQSRKKQLSARQLSLFSSKS